MQTGDIEGASVEELNQKIGTLEKEKNKEEEYRNYMQLERVSMFFDMDWCPCMAPFDQTLTSEDDPFFLNYRTRSMPSGRLRRRTWRTGGRSCVTRTEKWRKWKSATKWKSRYVP